MAHQYSRVGFKSSVEVNEVNLSLSYGGVLLSLRQADWLDQAWIHHGRCGSFKWPTPTKQNMVSMGRTFDPGRIVVSI